MNAHAEAAVISAAPLGSNSQSDAATLRRALCGARSAADKKAEELVLLDMRPVCTFTDVFLIATANSAPHVRAIADAIAEGLGREGARDPLVDGMEGLKWVVLDYGDIIVHVMTTEAREYFNLEGLWGDAPTIEWRDTA